MRPRLPSADAAFLAWLLAPTSKLRDSGPVRFETPSLSIAFSSSHSSSSPLPFPFFFDRSFAASYLIFVPSLRDRVLPIRRHPIRLAAAVHRHQPS